MSVKIPTYDARLTASGLLNARASGNEYSSAVGQSMQHLGSSLGNLEDAWQTKENADAIANTGKQLAESDGFWSNRLKTLSESSVDGGMVKDADGKNVPMTEALKGEFTKWREEFVGGIRNPKARAYAEQHINSLWAQTYQRSLATEATLGVENRSDKIDQSVLDWSNQAASDPSAAERAILAAKTMIANSGLDQHSRNQKAMAAEKAIRESAMYGAIQRDPTGAQSALKQVFGGGFDSAVEFTLQHEGGYKEADSNGKPVNYGINQAANPDVDVKNLTREGAKGIYKQRYWDKIGGDQLAAQNPALATAAFDTAVISGVGKAKDLLAQSGGDVNKFMDLREQFLAGLAKKNPEKFADYTKAWATRNADLRQQSAGANSSVADLARGLDPSRAYQFLNAATTEVNRQQSVYRSSMATTESSHVAAFMNGDTVPQPLTESDYVEAYGNIEGPQRFANYQSIQQMGTDVSGMKLLPPDQITALVERYKPDPAKPGYDLALQRYNMVTQAADTVLKARNADPMAYAVQNHIANAAPLPFSDPAQFGQALAQRAGVAKTMQDTYATPYSLLTQAEASTLTQGFQKMSTQQKLGYLNTIRTSIPDPKAYRSILQQIAPDSPVTAVAGNILGKQGEITVGHWFKPDEHYVPQDVSALMLEGEALINPTKAAGKEDGRGKSFPMPKEQDLRTAFNNAVGKAFAGDPTSADYAYQAVKAYYAGKASRIGDVSGEKNDDVLQQAVKAVLGGVTNFNGKGEVLRPWGMPEDTFKDAAKIAFDNAMQAAGMQDSPANKFGIYGLQSAGGDRYLLRAGTGYLLDKQGNPITLDLSQDPAKRNLPVTPPSAVAPDKSAKPNMQRPKTK